MTKFMPPAIDVYKQDAAAFALYKHENPEAIAESWETVGLPIVLDYRKKANVVLAEYLLRERLDVGSES